MIFTLPKLSKSNLKRSFRIPLIALSICLVFGSMTHATETSGEIFYKSLSSVVNSGDNDLIEEFNSSPRELDWGNAKTMQFKGNLRFLTSTKAGSPDQSRLFFIRSVHGEIFLLTIPDRNDPLYQNLEDLIESKLIFDLNVLNSQIGDKEYQFAQFRTPPDQPVFDKVFKLMIILMLFSCNGRHGTYPHRKRLCRSNLKTERFHNRRDPPIWDYAPDCRWSGLSDGIP